MRYDSADRAELELGSPNRSAAVVHAAGEALLLGHPRASIRITPLASGKRKIEVQRDAGPAVTRNGWETSYPVELILRILEATGPFSLCDEIAREESPQYTAAALKWALLSYLDEAEFGDKRILDFGCGSGASTAGLCRLFPDASVVGIDMKPAEVAAARARAEFFGFRNAHFAVSSESTSLNADLGTFDYVLLSGVYEHLLPAERVSLLHALWNVLEPGGVLFLRETPFRYFPIETHTTGLPLINYLPDRGALWVTNRFSKRWRNRDWQQLLRGGIRGGTIGEILEILARCRGTPRLLEPGRLGVQDRIDLWYLTVEKSRHARAKRRIYSALKQIKRLTGIEILPYLELAIRKERATT